MRRKLNNFLFSKFYNLCQVSRVRENYATTYKRKSKWCLLEGIGKAGVYWFS
jgi:hypothetical protein